MAKLVSTKILLSLIAGAALLVASGFMPLRAQQPSDGPGIREAQMPATGWLGVSIDEVSSQKAQELKLPGTYGVLVTEVGSDSPAAKAGLKNGDVITEYAGQRVEGVIEFRRLVRETPPGRTVNISVWRDGHSQTLSAEVGKAENRNPGDMFESMMRRFNNSGPNSFGFGATIPPRAVLGITAQDLSGQLGKYFGAPDGEGVLITTVESNSAAAKAGLEAGDVITKVDGNRVRTMRELRDRLREKREDKNVTLSVLRKGTEMSVNVEPQGGRRWGVPRSRRVPI
jgi:serine protease Do